MYKNKHMRLRKAAEQDVGSLYWLKQESWFGTHHHAIMNMADQEAWFKTIDNHPHSPRHMVLIAEVDRELNSVGVFMATIDWVNRNADVSWAVHEYFRKNGYGKVLVKTGAEFCFNILNLHRLSCEILCTNGASMKCATSAGFEQEGLRKEAVYKNGEYVGSCVMGLLKNNFTTDDDSTKTVVSPEERKGICLVSKSSHTIGP